MMCVIVNQQEPLALILNFEAASRMLKPPQRSDHLFERNTELDGERNHSQRVAHGMSPRHIQNCFTQRLFPPINAKDRSEVAKIYIRAPRISVRRKPG